MTGRDGYVTVLSEDLEVDGSHAQNHTAEVYVNPASEAIEHGHDITGPKMSDMLTMQKRSWYGKQDVHQGQHRLAAGHARSIILRGHGRVRQAVA